MSNADLKIDWATHAAAKYACEHWHYSQALPVGKMVKVGVWEDGKFVGVVLFAWGMNKSLGSPYGLQMGECCELVRVAMTSHKCYVSQVISLAIRFLKKQSPGLRLIVSFADPMENHHGGIYQAGNWVYSGKSSPSFEWRLNGKRLNKRAYTGEYIGGARRVVPNGAIKTPTQGKHRYLMPLDKQMRIDIQKLSKPYPKRVPSKDVVAPCDQQGEGGLNPTGTLHQESSHD